MLSEPNDVDVIVVMRNEFHAEDCPAEASGGARRGRARRTTRVGIVTSEGPLGNIGLPGSVEGIRHFRTMLETTRRRLSRKEIDEWVSSLEPEN